MATAFVVVVAMVVTLSSSSFPAYAYDLNPLQDFCVAVPDTQAAVFMNGKICKNPKLVTADDFVASGYNAPGNTTNSLGFTTNVAGVNEIPGLNTLGLTLIRVDIAPNGVVPPHTHPRATEMIILLEGTIYAGFVSSYPNMTNLLFAKILNPGDVFVIPIGLIHFQRNVGKTKALAIATFNSQSPGVITIPNSIFGTKPHISPEVLAKSFQLDKKVIDYLQSQF